MRFAEVLPLQGRWGGRERRGEVLVSRGRGTTHRPTTMKGGEGRITARRKGETANCIPGHHDMLSRGERLGRRFRAGRPLVRISSVPHWTSLMGFFCRMDIGWGTNVGILEGISGQKRHGVLSPRCILGSRARWPRHPHAFCVER